LRRASYVIVVICGIIGGWVGYWIGQPTVSLRYWTSQPAVSTSDFAWWSKHVDLPEGLQHHLAGLAAERQFPLWRFLLAIGMAVLFVCVAALVVEWLPARRAQKVLENGTPVEATVVRVEKTGEQRQV